MPFVPVVTNPHGPDACAPERSTSASPILRWGKSGVNGPLPHQMSLLGRRGIIGRKATSSATASQYSLSDISHLTNAGLHR